MPGGVVERVGVDDAGYAGGGRRRVVASERDLSATIARAMDVSASSGEAGPAGVGSLMASSARSTLQPVSACSSSVSRCPVGGSSRSMITVVCGDDLGDRHGF